MPRPVQRPPWPRRARRGAGRTRPDLYTNEELAAIVEAVPDLRIVEHHADRASLGPILGRVIRKDDTTLVARLSGAPPDGS